MRAPLLGLTALLVCSGCQVEPRLGPLKQGMDQVHRLIQDPRLVALASKEKGDPAQQIISALFSQGAKTLWPRRQGDESTYCLGNDTVLPGRIVYLQNNDLPWSVVVRPRTDGKAIRIEGYGVDSTSPVLTDEVNLK